MRRYLPAVLTVLILAQNALTVMPAQQESIEYRVKAAFLFNFTKFVQWPPAATSGKATFTICVLGDSLNGSLETTVRGETAAGKPIEVRPFTETADPRSCQILFVSEQAAARTPEIVRRLGAAPVLTVGEDENFIRNGGIVRFVRIARRLQFEVNPEPARRASLQISSQLLRVAHIVNAGEGRDQ